MVNILASVWGVGLASGLRIKCAQPTHTDPGVEPLYRTAVALTLRVNLTDAARFARRVGQEGCHDMPGHLARGDVALRRIAAVAPMDRLDKGARAHAAHLSVIAQFDGPLIEFGDGPRSQRRT
jgi:hypothetical protein